MDISLKKRKDTEEKQGYVWESMKVAAYFAKEGKSFYNIVI